MDLHKIISELQAEKQRLDEAIEALERLSSVSAKTKRGRPPLTKSKTDKDTMASKAAAQS